MKLVELATIGDIKDGRVLKLQRSLALNMDFRRAAVQKVLTNRGSKTGGIDHELITNDKQKWETVE